MHRAFLRGHRSAAPSRLLVGRCRPSLAPTQTSARCAALPLHTHGVGNNWPRLGSAPAAVEAAAAVRCRWRPSFVLLLRVDMRSGLRPAGSACGTGDEDGAQPLRPTNASPGPRRAARGAVDGGPRAARCGHLGDGAQSKTAEPVAALCTCIDGLRVFLGECVLW